MPKRGGLGQGVTPLPLPLDMKNTEEKFAVLIQDRRARRGVEKHAPHLLEQYDALVKNGAAEMMRAVYDGGLADGVLGATGASMAELEDF